ncbi:hypothetical protein DMC01_08485 [Campylobacter troglodytis]|nr:hypothetical protein DMC01_08485 [Campylobacter troglodytis]
MEKGGRGAGKKTPVFLLRDTRLVTASKRLVKTQRLVYTLKHLLCQRVIADYKRLCRCPKHYNFRRASKPTVPWLIFYFALLVPLRSKDTRFCKTRQIRVCKGTQPHKLNCEFFYFVTPLVTA